MAEGEAEGEDGWLTVRLRERMGAEGEAAGEDGGLRVKLRERMGG